MKFKITYQPPEAEDEDERKSIIKDFVDTPFVYAEEWAEDYAYRYADKVVSMLPKAKAHMESRGMAAEKFNYIPNGIDINEWDATHKLPEDIWKSLMRVKHRGLPVVGYAGTHGLANALDVLLNAAKSSIRKVEFVLVGAGPLLSSTIYRVQDQSQPV